MKSAEDEDDGENNLVIHAGAGSPPPLPLQWSVMGSGITTEKYCISDMRDWTAEGLKQYLDILSNT